MKKKVVQMIMLFVIAIVIIAWMALTVLVEVTGPKRERSFGEAGAAAKAIIVYDPDPFYNLDQQVCESFAQTLATKGWFAKVMTVAAARKNDCSSFDLYVFCANTYNWAPDWSVTRYIKKDVTLKDKKVVSIVLGAGSTSRSKKAFEDIIKKQGADLVGSRTYWLWKPNDQDRLKESNVKVVVEMAQEFAGEIAKKY
jgi:hypothetical protein